MLELREPARDRRRGAAGDHRDREPRAAGRDEGQPSRTWKRFHSSPGGSVEEDAVGEHAVDVEHEEPHLAARAARDVVVRRLRDLRAEDVVQVDDAVRAGRSRRR